MTIPQIISSVGWTMFIIALAFTVLHTINVSIPGVDFIAPTSRLGVWGFIVGVPLTILGGAIGVLGFFAEQIEDWWLNREDKPDK
jgi:hypothetical protein